MAVPYIEPAAELFDAGRAGRRPARLRGLLNALIAGLAKLKSFQETRYLDEMTEGQLADIGVRRICSSVRWLDCRETPLRIDFEYRGIAEERPDGWRSAWLD